MNDFEKTSIYWSKVYKKISHDSRKYLGFWDVPTINQHINKKICGNPLLGFGEGAEKFAYEFNKSRIYKNAISIGCGSGYKEIDLILRGIVEKFTLYDIAEIPLQKAKELAIAKGVENKIDFVLGDPINNENVFDKYDFVHWNSSLHHMFDTGKAIEWSYNVLKKNGVFYMYEYIGPNRMQFTDEVMIKANLIRNALEIKYFKYPGIKFADQKFTHITYEVLKEVIKKILRSFRIREPYISRICKRVNLSDIIKNDPSEAVDSERIMKNVQKYFPNAKTVFLGGIVYFIALSGILPNFDEKKDINLLKLLLFIDDMLSEDGYNLFAFSIAFKE